MTNSSLNRVQIGQLVRRHVREQLYDESDVSAHGVAIYILSDPRSLRDVRYVGQTSSPARRFLQHLKTARLWLPDPELRLLPVEQAPQSHTQPQMLPQRLRSAG